MPSAYCPSCGAMYDSPMITPNGPFCRYCLARGDVVQLLATAGRRFRRSRKGSGGHVERAASRERRATPPR